MSSHNSRVSQSKRNYESNNQGRRPRRRQVFWISCSSRRPVVWPLMNLKKNRIIKMIPAGARVKAKVRAEREKPIVHHLSNSTHLITLLPANLSLALYWSKVTVQLAKLFRRWNLKYHRAPGFSTHRLQDRKKKSSQSNHDCTIWTRRHSQISPVSMTLWRETICIMKLTVRSPLCRNSPKTKRLFQSLSLRLRRSSCLVSWNKQAALRSMIKSRKGQFKCRL